ncbi:NADH dehydrogenase [ubiquinone] 1 alpha subcomplex subunit 12-like [Mytilus galloprovincialis]|uniref:NADH dehydrogenase [ubiquinone] 1 alpha subcomplex subunit 12-like n=1 Tax=Mytilus edulis TaxID=6550 RepID=UPI0039EE607B
MSFIRPYTEVFRSFGRIIKQNGGIMSSVKTMFYTDDLKEGTLKGTDKYGNNYYENNKYFIGRNRWIVYNRNQGFCYDSSQIPAEWHGWLHYSTDETPIDNPPVKRKWMVDVHTENLSGTKECYVPYSTTRPKIESWQPPQ